MDEGDGGELTKRGRDEDGRGEKGAKGVGDGTRRVWEGLGRLWVMGCDAMCV